jgi:Protein of unknown function (DUF429)
VAAAHLGCNASPVTRILAVDWSGARTGEHRAIWLGEARNGRLLRLEGGRGREQLVAHLLAEAERDPELVVGLDFAFSLPEWFLHAQGIDDHSNAWDLVSREAEAWLCDPQPPFWRERKPPDDGFRRTERECGGRPKSVFQLVGAGQVGTGSLRGIPFLPRLRERLAIWPFDEPRLPLLVEIYPRLHLASDVSTGHFRRTHGQSPRVLMVGTASGASARLHLDGATGYPNEHARDAAAAALAMSRWPGDWSRLPRDPEYALEGRIWHEGLVLEGG